MLAVLVPMLLTTTPDYAQREAALEHSAPPVRQLASGGREITLRAKESRQALTLTVSPHFAATYSENVALLVGLGSGRAPPLPSPELSSAHR
jgi:hypothetical protein